MRTVLSTTILAIAVCFAASAHADDRTVRLAVPDDLVETGLLKYMLPRFTLKTQVRVEILPPGSEADVTLGADGTPLFRGQGATWSLGIISDDHPGTVKFEGWLTSDVGLRTITDFKIDGASVFEIASIKEDVDEGFVFEGDAALGLKLSVTHCGRCHVSVSDQPMLGIGSTPSFFVLRALEDWDIRFQTFYVLNPHPSFTQIEEITEPFPVNRPSPIVPVELTLDEFDAILAYVSALEPADLGAPHEVQEVVLDMFEAARVSGDEVLVLQTFLQHYRDHGRQHPGIAPRPYLEVVVRHLRRIRYTGIEHDHAVRP